MAGDLIERLDLGNVQFVRQLKKLDPPVFAMVCERMALLMKPPPYPSVLHVHALTGRTVRSALDPRKQVPVWTMHVTKNNDKVSFTIESGTAYFRTFGTHQEIDSSP
jgi:hypothetical protein